MDKISVIVPVYNSEKYITRCLDSLLSQTYKDLEIICINDGSTDTSGKICDDSAKKDNRIKVFHTENRGVSAARNIGLDNFTGDYVGFVDSDDWIEAEMYEKLYSLAKSSGADISSCSFYFDGSNDKIKAENRLQVPEYAIKSEDFLEYIYRRDMYKGVSGYVFTRLYSACLFKSSYERGSKIRFCDKLAINEDSYFLAECSVHSGKVIFVDLPFYHYCDNPSSLMHSENKRLNGFPALKAYEKIIELYQKHNISSRILDLVKRFYVYHAGMLLELAMKLGYYDKAELLRLEVMRYLDIYERTNREFPERIKNIHIIINSIEKRRQRLHNENQKK